MMTLTRAIEQSVLHLPEQTRRLSLCNDTWLVGGLRFDILPKVRISCVLAAASSSAECLSVGVDGSLSQALVDSVIFRGIDLYGPPQVLHIGRLQPLSRPLRSRLLRLDIGVQLGALSRIEAARVERVARDLQTSYLDRNMLRDIGEVQSGIEIWRRVYNARRSPSGGYQS
jgi:hypothetical protein